MSPNVPVLIGGSPSSGSTLLSVILDAHPDIVCGPEIGLLAHSSLYAKDFPRFAQGLKALLEKNQWQKNDALFNLSNGYCPYALVDEGNLAFYGHTLLTIKSLLTDAKSFEEFVEGLFGNIQERTGKSIIAEKTPSNLYAFDAYLERFANGRVIYLVRDPRAVIASLLRRGFGLRRAISVWLLEAAICERFNEHPRVMRVRYEDLVLSTEDALRKISDFLEVRTDLGAMLEYRHRSERVDNDSTLSALTSWNANPTQGISKLSLDAWRTELDVIDLAIMENSVISHAPPGMEWLVGIKLKKLAEGIGYQWHTRDVDVNELCTGLLKERMVDAKSQRFDKQYFQERFVESSPVGLTGSSSSLWAAVVKGIAAAHERDEAALEEIVKMRGDCAYWHAKYEKTNELLNVIAQERDSLQQEISRQTEYNEQIANEREHLAKRNQ